MAEADNAEDGSGRMSTGLHVMPGFREHPGDEGEKKERKLGKYKIRKRDVEGGEKEEQENQQEPKVSSG